MRFISQVALASVVVAFLCFLLAALAARRRTGGFTVFLGLVAGGVFLLAGLLTSSLALGTLGYAPFTGDVVAATVTLEPIDEESFRASFRFPEGDPVSVDLRGDELYMDVHILKWKPIVQFLGLQTEYELDRVAGRHRELEAEPTRARTVYSIASPKPFDLFDVVRQNPVLLPLVDAEYASASFYPASGTYELRVSTAGGLVSRPVDPTEEP